MVGGLVIVGLKWIEDRVAVTSGVRLGDGTASNTPSSETLQLIIKKASKIN
jgi:hypothetical protein